VQAIDRILAILDIVASDGPAAPTEIAAKMDLPFSTVARLVRELAEVGLLDREANEARDYILGWKIFELATSGRSARDLSVVAVPAMTRLRDATGETVSLHVLRGDHRLCVAEVQSTRELRRVMPAGTVQGLIGTTGGEVLLAGLDDSMLGAAADRLDLSAQARSALMKQLAVVRKEGRSVAYNKKLGVTALSVPITRAGSVLAALTVSGPSMRFTLKHAASGFDAAVECAEAIARAV
jgi:DNA-binding IclR family transcriptional regulator